MSRISELEHKVKVLEKKFKDLQYQVIRDHNALVGEIVTSEHKYGVSVDKTTIMDLMLYPGIQSD